MLQFARNQVSDLTSRLEQSQVLTHRRDAEIDALQLKLSDIEKQRVADQRCSAEELERHAEERHQQEEHATITERRLMTELDRERQETKRFKLKSATVGTTCRNSWRSISSGEANAGSEAD